MIRVRKLAWVISAVLLALCTQVFVAIDMRSHSITDTLYSVFPFWTSAFLLWNWIGSRSSTAGSIGERIS